MADLPPPEMHLCHACFTDRPSAAFVTLDTPQPVCVSCQARGSKPKQQAALRRGQWSADAGPAVTPARGALGHSEAHDEWVYITRGGSCWHRDEGCGARGAGQADAFSMGYRIHPVRKINLRQVSALRTPCSQCAG